MNGLVVAWHELLKTPYLLLFWQAPEHPQAMRGWAPFIQPNGVKTLNLLGLPSERLHKSKIFSTPSDSSPSFSLLFMIELTFSVVRFSRKQKIK